MRKVVAIVQVSRAQNASTRLADALAISKTMYYQPNCFGRTDFIPAWMSALSTESLPMLAAHMSRSMLSVPACGFLTNMRLWSQPQSVLLMTLCSVSALGISSVRSISCNISSKMPVYLHGNLLTQRGSKSRPDSCAD